MQDLPVLPIAFAIGSVLSTLTAQAVTVDRVHATDFTMRADPTRTWNVPAGTPAQNPSSVSLGDVAFATPPASGATRTYAVHTGWSSVQPGLVRYDTFEESTAGRHLGSGTGPAAGAATGPHEITLRIHSPLRGMELYVDLSATVTRIRDQQIASDTTADVKIDVGNDGSFELDAGGNAGTYHSTVSVSVPPGTLEIRVFTATSAIFLGGAHGAVDTQARINAMIQVEPRAINRIGPYNSNCQARLFTRLRPDLVGRIAVFTEIWETSAPQLLVVGAGTVNLPLPGGCLLGVTNDVLLVFTPVPPASPSLVLELPPALPSGLTMHAQAISLDAALQLVSGPRNDLLLR